MTKIKKEHKDIIESGGYFIKDEDLYTYWILSKEGLLPVKDYFGLNELFLNYSSGKENFKKLYKITDFDNRFYVGVYSDCDAITELPKSLKDITGCETKDKPKVLQIMKKMAKDSITGKELYFVSNLLSYNITSNLYLMPITDAFQKDDNINKELIKYIDAFINGELFIEDNNYFNFQKQKLLFIKLIREMKALEEFGKNFIITNIGAGNPFSHNNATLFLHTVFALEQLGYIKVLKVWFQGHDKPIKFNVNIVPQDSFKELIYQDFKKENPKTIIEGYDEKKGVLIFSGKNIPISKSGKETDPSLLLKTLLKAEGEDYLHNDEIFEDWGFNEEDVSKASKNKIYFAGQKINKDIQLATGIEDFLDIATTKARINPKYKK